VAKGFKDFVARVDGIVQDTGKLVPAADKDEAIKQAITQRYSKDRPQEIVTEQQGSALNDQALPQKDQATNFEEGFSSIKQIEFPIDQVPAALLDQEDWELFRKADGLKLRILSTVPAASETLRVTWTARHKSDGTTVPESDFDAVCDYAAALVFSKMAARATQIGDNSISADTVNYRTKGQEYMTLGKDAAKRYLDHLGISTGGAQQPGGETVAPAMASGEMDIDMGWGGDRLIHGRRTR
jgi:hypothetical protein